MASLSGCLAVTSGLLSDASSFLGRVELLQNESLPRKRLRRLTPPSTDNFSAEELTAPSVLPVAAVNPEKAQLREQQAKKPL